MNKFKTGDKVVCVDASGWNMGHIKEGKTYKIERVNGADLKLWDVPFTTKVWRFELVEK